MSTTLELPAQPAPKGGAGSPELAKMTPSGRVYTDPLPWCPMLRTLGIEERDFAIGAEFSSVTTLLNYLPKDRLVAWNAKMAAECAIEFHWLLKQFGPVISLDYWKKAGERYRDMAGERGTLVHDVAEDGESIIHKAADELLAGHDVSPRFLQDANVAPYVKALQKFFTTWPGIRPIWTEVSIFSRRFGYGGTLDLIAYVPGLGVVILDWKTSKHLGAKMAMQLGGYRWGDYGIGDGVRVPIPKVRAGFIIWLMPGEDGEGAFEVVPAATDFEMVADIYPAMHAIKRLDKPSRLGKPVEHAALVDDAPPAPVLRFITPAEVAEHLADDDAAELHDLSVPVQVRVDHERTTVRRWQIDYANDRAKALGEAVAAGNPMAVHCFGALSTWYAERGLPGVDAMTDIELWSTELAELCMGLAWAEREAELPFGPDQAPPPFDFDDLRRQYEREQAEAIRAGRLRIEADGTLTPTPRRPGVPEGTVTSLRRGRSTDPEEWLKPRDPELATIEAELIEAARRLPSDAIDELIRWGKAAGMPNLTARVANRDQLTSIANRVAELQADAEKRWNDLQHLGLLAFPGSMDEAGPVLAPLIGAHPFDPTEVPMTEAQCEMAAMLLLAARHGVVDIIDGALTCVVDDARILQLVGGTKSAALKAARAAAERLGVPKPKSSGDAFVDPILVAALAVPALRAASAAA